MTGIFLSFHPTEKVSPSTLTNISRLLKHRGSSNAKYLYVDSSYQCHFEDQPIDMDDALVSAVYVRARNEFTLGYTGLEVFDGEKCIAEIDLMMVISGKIALVECKTGRDIQENDIDKLVVVADRINADVLMFCTLDAFSDASLELIKEKTKNLLYKILILSKEDLINQFSGRGWIFRLNQERGTSKSFHQLFVENISRMI